MIKIAGASILALLVLLLIAGFRLDAAKSEAKLAKKEALDEKHRAEGLAKILRIERDNTAKAAAIETKYLESLHRAELENDSLRSAVESGRAQLRVKATCPKLPATATAKPVTDAGAPELDRDARQAYYDLRAQHSAVTAQVLALQEFARLCAQITP